MSRSASPAFVFSLIAFGTILGIAGTDLILPAVPTMPRELGGTPALAQMVLAAYAAGTLVGLLTFGELGARYSPRKLLIWSLTLFAFISTLAAFAPTLEWLVAFRLVQGAFGSGPAVFAPGFIQGLFTGDKAAGMFGRLGSIESLTPALAPLAGALLLGVGGWETSFFVLGGCATFGAIVSVIYSRSLPDRTVALETHRSYLSVLRDATFLRHALSQAFSLSAILIFVFGAPVVMTETMDGGIQDFILLQICGIANFILASNLSSTLASKFGVERVIFIGTAALFVGFLLILAYVQCGGSSLAVIVPIWVITNGAFGVRGPIGFHQAIVASNGDHSRGAALVVAAILGFTATGTAGAAPFISFGWWPLALVSCLAAALAFLCLVLFP
ncbi:MFS transporter [Rhizobium brockwellii]|jgi:MFS family permease|uniref:MFS transporter n=1 Tax=Rhizobium brockwellii TaxID=3019932 RepID=UPI003F9D5E7A